jgi:uncharacterized DUF497 family protein
MGFSWDPRKAAANSEKHGISFEEAMTVFADPEALDWEDDAHSLEEARSKRLGRSVLGRVVLMVYTVRGGEHGKETIRIISARQGSRRERQAYARQ